MRRANGKGPGRWLLVPTPGPQQSVRDPLLRIQGNKMGVVGREYRYRSGNRGSEVKYRSLPSGFASLSVDEVRGLDWPQQDCIFGPIGPEQPCLSMGRRVYG